MSMGMVKGLKSHPVKRISVRDLRKRMYVCGYGYRESADAGPRVSAGYLVMSDNGIARLQQRYTHVWIDTGRGVDVLPMAGGGVVSAIQRPLSGRPSRTISERALLRQVRRLRERSVGIVGSLMEDIRFGRTLELRGAREAVDETIHQVLKNTEAMIYLALLKNTDASLAQRAVNTCILTLAFAKYLSVSKRDLVVLGMGALLYDVGMTRIPDALRNKTGPLDAGEIAEMRRHVAEGVRMLRNTGNMPEKALSIVRTHHERFDGTGYPAGLKGKELGLFDRMVAIVSVYSALISERPHAPVISMKSALATLYEECGKGFDTRLVHKFIQCVGVYPAGCPVMLNTGEAGVVVAVNSHHRLHPVVRVDVDADKSSLEQSRLLDLASLESRDLMIKRVMEPNEYQIEVSADGGTDRLRLLQDHRLELTGMRA